MDENKSEQSAFYADDEISIADIAGKIWQRRGLVVLLPVLAVLAAVILQLLNSVLADNPTVYYVQLDGIDKSTYPNGTLFSPQDLLLPEVVERAAQSLNLADYQMVRNHIQVEYGSPLTKAIQQKYQLQLSAKNLSAVDVENINRNFSQEQQRVTEGGLKITVNHDSLGLQPEQGAILAEALPRAWVEVFKDKYRVFVHPRLENVSITNVQDALTSTSDILFARTSLQRMRRGLNVLSQDNRLSSLESQSGLSRADLESEVSRFSEIYFRPLFAATVVNSVDSASSFFVEQIKLKVEELINNIDEIDRAIADVRNFQPQSTMRQAGSGSDQTLQLSDNTLRQVIDLANQASLSDYLKQLLTDRRELAAQKASLLTEIAESQVKMDIGHNKEFRKLATEEFVRLAQEYISLLSAARTMIVQRSGNFYRPLGTPTSDRALLPPKFGLYVALSLLLGVFAAMMLALVWPTGSKES